ncbi:hypothetical protein SAMN04488104_10625 [Algoriphagus faecimaris]|uniref:6-bladed beta-propeller protein n=1 Tax=Algoriphagus faecimaris TaxID=686796 RepID=A0A1G6XP90_9BACT|nr:6-bladed beta-propeller [Algoriphagus faecimaris]SDD79187.1 hypothetical protein SAMN04488104_10625 [Algoriphagus faecimaris]
MNPYKFSFWVIIPIFFLSCTFNGDLEIKKLVLNELDIVQKNELTIQKVISLETTSENLMGTDIRVRFDALSFYLMDENSKTVIHQFDREGEYRGAVAQVGDGPGYLKDLDDFLINSEGRIEVLSAIGDQASVYEVSVSGEIIPVFQTDYLASSFTNLPSGEYLLYGSYNLPFTKFRLVKADSGGKVTSAFLDNTYENKLLPMTERNFFKNGNDIHIIESFQPYVYSFHNDTLEKVIQMDFGSYSIPDYFWQEDIMNSFGKMSETGFANLHGVFEDENLMLLSIHVQKPEGIFKELVFIDKSTDKIQKLSTNMNDDLLYHYPIGIEDGQAMFLTYRSVILNELSKTQLDQIQSKIPKKEFDYPVILKTNASFDK